MSVGAAVGVLATTFRVEEGEEARVCSATKIPAAHLRARPLVARREQNRTGEALVHWDWGTGGWCNDDSGAATQMCGRH